MKKSIIMIDEWGSKITNKISQTMTTLPKPFWNNQALMSKTWNYFYFIWLREIERLVVNRSKKLKTSSRIWNNRGIFMKKISRRKMQISRSQIVIRFQNDNGLWLQLYKDTSLLLQFLTYSFKPCIKCLWFYLQTWKNWNSGDWEKFGTIIMVKDWNALIWVTSLTKNTLNATHGRNSAPISN